MVYCVKICNIVEHFLILLKEYVELNNIDIVFMLKFQCESEENADHNSEELFSSCTCLDPKPALQNTDRHKVYFYNM
jgi:hypothetical protein